MPQENNVATSTTKKTNTNNNNNNTHLQQKRTRNRRRSGKEEDGNGRNRGGRSDRLKKKEEKPQRITTDTAKPVLESSNPFFIAVCAPETYKSAASSSPAASPVVHYNEQSHRVKPNVFLRSRPRSNLLSNMSPNLAYPNRFIHHPALQHERQRETSAGVTMTEVETVVGVSVASTSDDIEHFPSLKSSSASASLSASKLNFKEMVMKNNTSTNTSTSTSTNTSTTTTMTAATTTAADTGAGSGVRGVTGSSYTTHSFKSSIIPQKILSSSNIFLAAFHATEDKDNDNDNNHDDYHDSSNLTKSGGHVIASSILVDSCDKKYDRLYR
jgi:hypothetical protein